MHRSTIHTLDTRSMPFSSRRLLREERRFVLVSALALVIAARVDLGSLWSSTPGVPVHIATGGVTKAYPVPALRSAPETFTDTVGGQPLHITNSPAGVHFTARTADGEELPQVNVYWYAWAAFHPDTQVYSTPAEADIQSQNSSTLVLN